MGFWEALFGVGLGLGILLFAFVRRAPGTPVGAGLLLAGASVFGVRMLQAGPYVAPGGFDLFVGAVAIGLGSVLLFRRGLGDRAALAARLGVALAPLTLIGTAIATLHEIGEIATLRTIDARGAVRETRLAFVEYEDATWIGAGSGERRQWFRELVAQPRVELVRGDASSCRIANPIREPVVREEVSRRLEEKYLSGRVVAAFGSHLFLNPEAIVIRLDPCAE